MSSRRMAYPITLGAKLANFPYKLYFQKSWAFRMTCFSFLLCLPIFMKIESWTYSPANLQKYEEYKRKEENEYKHHLEHLY